jgi:hypothetical protein
MGAKEDGRGNNNFDKNWKPEELEWELGGSSQ